jgi:hypothetical protein
MRERASFGIETTLAGKNALRLMERAKAAGYEIQLLTLEQQMSRSTFVESRSVSREAATTCLMSTCGAATFGACQTHQRQS